MAVDNSPAIAGVLTATFTGAGLTIPEVPAIQRNPYPGPVPAFLVAETDYLSEVSNDFRRHPKGTYTAVFLLARYNKDLDPTGALALYNQVKELALTAFNTVATRTANGTIPGIVRLNWRVDPQGPYITWMNQTFVGAYLVISTTELVQRTNS